jgi:hypothetical protein
MASDLHFVDISDGRFNKTGLGELDALFNAVTASTTPKHLVVHFHGGLVSGRSAAETIETLLPVYAKGNAYPCFFVWHSDIWSTIRKNLGELPRDRAFQRLVKRVLQLVAGKLAESASTRGGVLELDSLVEMPSGLEELEVWAATRDLPQPKKRSAKRKAVAELTDIQRAQVEKELLADTELKAEAQRVAAQLAPPPERGTRGAVAAPTDVGPPTQLSQEVRDEIEAELRAQSGDLAQDETARSGTLVLLTLAKHAATVVYKVVQRYVQKREHGLYTTVIEEIIRDLFLDSVGAVVWSLMKRDTADAFRDEIDQFGGTAFVDRLAKWWTSPDQRVTLVGHSTGALFIAHLIERADDVLPADRQFDVVFLAPACTFEFMAQHLPVFRRRVRGIRVFALSDQLERGYWEVPALYRGSLLYIVSGLLEDGTVDMPLVGMQRYYSGAEPFKDASIVNVTQYLDKRVVWSVAKNPIGRRTAADRHGGFADDAATQESLVEILKNGC